MPAKTAAKPTAKPRSTPAQVATARAVGKGALSATPVQAGIGRSIGNAMKGVESLFSRPKAASKKFAAKKKAPSKRK